MRYHEYQPHEALRDEVRCLWVLDHEYPPDSVQDVTPDGCAELIFSFGAPYVPLGSVAGPGELPVANIVGFQNQTIQFRVSGHVKIVAARLHPWAMVSLLDHAEGNPHSVRGIEADWDALIARISAPVQRDDYERAAMELQGYVNQEHAAAPR